MLSNKYYIKLKLVFNVILILFFIIMMYSESKLLLIKRPLALHLFVYYYILVLLIILMFGSLATVLFLDYIRCSSVLYFMCSLGLGVAFLTLLSYILVLFNLLYYRIIILLLIFIIFVELIIIKRHIRIIREKLLSINVSIESNLSLAAVISGVLFALFHFVRLGYTINVIPVGDAISHATIISLTLFHHGIPSFDPIYNSSLPVPYRGFHSFVSLITIILNIYPVHSLVVVASLISALITIIISLFIYEVTKDSLSFSIALIYTLIVPQAKLIPPWPSNDLTLGNLVNGTYPQHMSNFLVLICILVGYILMKNLYGDSNIFSNNSFLRCKTSKILCIKAVAVFTIVAIAAAITNPVNTGIVILIISLIFLVTIISRRNLILLLMYLFFIMLSIGVFSHFVGPKLQTIFRVDISKYHISFEYIMHKRLFQTLIITLAYSSVFKKALSTRKLNFLDLYQLSLGLLLLLSINEMLFRSFLWILFPTRSYLVLYAISIMTLFSCLRSIIHSPKMKIDSLLTYLCVVAIALSNLGGMLYNLNFIPSNWDRVAGCDYKGITFILSISGIKDLILNDPNWIGMSITAFRPQRVVFERTLMFYFYSARILNNTFVKRANELIKIFTNTSMSYKEVYDLLMRYKVKYIFISSSNDYYNFSVKKYMYKVPKKDIAKYLLYFDKNPYLEKIFSCNNVRVYRVKVKD